MNNSSNSPYKLPGSWNTNAANTSNATNSSNRTGTGLENSGNVGNPESLGNSIHPGHQGRRTSSNDNANVANSTINTGNSSTPTNWYDPSLLRFRQSHDHFSNDIIPRVTGPPPATQRRLPPQSASLEFLAGRDAARDARIQDLLNSDNNNPSNSRNIARFYQESVEAAVDAAAAAASIASVRLAPLLGSGQGRQSERAAGAGAGDTNRAATGAGQAAPTPTNRGGTGHNPPSPPPQQQRVSGLLGGSGGGGARDLYNGAPAMVWNEDLFDRPRHGGRGRGYRNFESEEEDFESEEEEAEGRSPVVRGWDYGSGGEEEYGSGGEEEYEGEEDEEEEEGGYENMVGREADESRRTGSHGWDEPLDLVGPIMNHIVEIEGYQLPQPQTPVQLLGGEGGSGLVWNGAAGNGDGNRNNNWNNPVRQDNWNLPLPHRSGGTMATTINHNQNHNPNQNQQNQAPRSINPLSNIVDLTCSPPPRQHQSHSTPNHANQSRSAPNDSAEQHSAKRRKTSGQGGAVPISEIITLDIDDSTGEAEESEQEEQQEKKPPVIEEEKPKKLAGLACIICMEDEPVDLSVTPCGHMFCNSCLYNAIKTTLAAPHKVHGKCPVCRGKVAIKDIIILEVKERQEKGKQRAD
ncbi:Similar to E3 ubiquitin-protein ligase complex slx8-rfp subunit slx8; acc. no. P87176 [Pyronema omphalodes CBS 100304]|uniref:Similar to E3 ubiquitin-protein ligase complex slx8-rfp subunit slx8 acc. no. P87176 n=1 Tax=Pyronema omphalodes (strain CBS 100304) TaxID=1076935 RepID=U4LHJ2_PYROM|nr:Similar to E3 ubiquitin-protein ligase complex slx8-rfp subunit slx8; acc. no. P87176 [Pyronema omphalodes CBS 100304]